MRQKAPEWQIHDWINTASPLSVESLRGRVVVLHAFQMLCPGCVQHGLPQALRIHETFDSKQVQVIGLHSVFEHHQVMTPAALSAFVHEYRWPFPIAIDQPDKNSDIPLTMKAYALRGTPSLVLIDRGGNIRDNLFGRPNDMVVGAKIMNLVNDRAALDNTKTKDEQHDPGCTDTGCSITSPGQ